MSGSPAARSTAAAGSGAGSRRSKCASSPAGRKRALGGRHLYALRSRFLPAALEAHFDLLDPAPEPAAAVDLAVGEPLIDLGAALRAGWTPHGT